MEFSAPSCGESVAGLENKSAPTFAWCDKIFHNPEIHGLFCRQRLGYWLHGMPADRGFRGPQQRSMTTGAY